MQQFSKVRCLIKYMYCNILLVLPSLVKLVVPSHYNRNKSLFQIPLKADMSATSSFAVWFLKLKKLSLLAASCPDVMSFVTDEASQPTEKEQWLGVASALQVSILLPIASSSLCSQLVSRSQISYLISFTPSVFYLHM